MLHSRDGIRRSQPAGGEIAWFGRQYLRGGSARVAAVAVAEIAAEIIDAPAELLLLPLTYFFFSSSAGSSLAAALDGKMKVERM